MNEDVADGVLLDVREVGMADLLDDGSSALDKVLEWLLTSNVDGYDRFSSKICGTPQQIRLPATQAVAPAGRRAGAEYRDACMLVFRNTRAGSGRLVR